MQRFEQVKNYIDFSSADEGNIAALAPLVEGRGDEIIDRFYAKILETPETRAILTGGETQVARLKETFRVWLGQLVRGPWDARYFALRSRIGRRHVEVGLPSESMFAAMNVMRTLIGDLVCKTSGDPSRAVAIMRSVDKILDLELSIMIGSYEEDLIESARERERDALRSRMASLEATAAGFAHEVGNPLGSLTINLELLRRRLLSLGDSGRGSLETLDGIRASVRRLERLVREVQDYSRGTPPVLRSIDVADLVERFAKEERSAAAQNGFEVACRIEARPVVRADPDQLLGVFRHLARNAFEAMEAGGCLTIRVAEVTGEATVAFRDTGSGIAAGEQAKIFGVFYSRKPQGSGMGLAVSERIVHAHGGRITVESAPGEGSTFTVSLPLA